MNNDSRHDGAVPLHLVRFLGGFFFPQQNRKVRHTLDRKTGYGVVRGFIEAKAAAEGEIYRRNGDFRVGDAFEFSFGDGGSWMR